MKPEFPINTIILDDTESILSRFKDDEERMQWLNALRSEGAVVHQEGSSTHISLSGAYGFHSIKLALGEHVCFVKECTSTQQLASDVDNETTIFVADYQTAGRGRLGRSWLSEAGHNILLSMRMYPKVTNDQLARCSLLWAAAIAERLDLCVKWPNDIVTSSGQKIGGILTTLEYDSQQNPVLIFGLGLNVGQQDFDGLEQATSLSAVYGTTPSRLGVLLAIVQSVRTVNPLDSLDSWRRRAQMLGQKVQVAGYEGIAVDIREDGALIVGENVILSGDVELIEEIQQ